MKIPVRLWDPMRRPWRQVFPTPVPVLNGGCRSSSKNSLYQKTGVVTTTIFLIGFGSIGSRRSPVRKAKSRLGFSACRWLLGFSACFSASRLLGFSACRWFLGFSASRLHVARAVPLYPCIGIIISIIMIMIMIVFIATINNYYY